MRVAIITNLFPPIQTGSAYWAEELAAALAGAGDEVVVVTCRVGGAPEVERRRGVTVHRLPPVKRLPALRLFMNFDQFYLLWSRANLERTMSILREQRVELVHQCGQLLDSILLTRQACRRLDLPSVCSIHTKIYHPGSRLYDAVLRAADKTAVRRLAISGFDCVIALDKTIADYVSETYRPRRVVIVPPCIDSRLVEVAAADPASDGRLHVLSVGHVTEMRNRAELFPALAELRKGGRELRLTVVGKILTEGAKRMIDALGLSDDVHFTGEVARDRLIDLLRSAHFEAHWLDIPGIGTAALEAMALGLPIITHGYEGIYGGEVPFRHGENVMFVDPRSPGAVRDAACALARDPALRGIIGANARRLVKTHLTWEPTVAKIRSHYESVLG